MTNNNYAWTVVIAYAITIVGAIVLSIWSARKDFYEFHPISLSLYRKQHPRCRYCAYCHKIHTPIHLNYISLYKCELKDKTIRFFNYNWRGCLCKYYKYI